MNYSTDEEDLPDDEVSAFPSQLSVFNVEDSKNKIMKFINYSECREYCDFLHSFLIQGEQLNTSSLVENNKRSILYNQALHCSMLAQFFLMRDFDNQKEYLSSQICELKKEVAILAKTPLVSPKQRKK
ncbi:hypothetical protein NPIL_498281 [Nephila pilipes]|uniref:Uncharacterized protein n=1 Tax=Nephila pilipes TaxID=299642 RepID=A0A8X6J821_NEPPI|nr:hypothetical protein NPIL_498281 [Nephila pilipes]